MKIEKSCKLLNIPNNRFYLDGVFKYIFDNSGKKPKEKTFDYDYDFKYYYADFKAIGIDLLKDDINWFEFSNMLRKFILSDNSCIAKVLEYRTYEKPSENMKTQEAKIHKNKMELKREYALPTKKNIDGSLDKMWNFIEKKVGDNNE